MFETENPRFKADKTRVCGKIFTLTHDTNASGRIDIDDLEWDYLDGDGDFRSAEVTALRDEADIIITNPPFSLFREFLGWIMEADKQFAIIGNMNAITYKEVFPLIKENKIWIDNPFVRGAGYFTSPMELDKSMSYFNSHDYREGFIRVPGVRWFTNIELGRRHQPMQLMTMSENLKFSKKLKGQNEYYHYDNYDAIEVPFTELIPRDFDGIMGVPISFLDKYCPDQFEIIWRGGDMEWAENECTFFTKPDDDKAEIYKQRDRTWRVQNPYLLDSDGFAQTVYQRIFIRKKQ